MLHRATDFKCQWHEWQQKNHIAICWWWWLATAADCSRSRAAHQDVIGRVEETPPRCESRLPCSFLFATFIQHLWKCCVFKNFTEALFYQKMPLKLIIMYKWVNIVRHGHQQAVIFFGDVLSGLNFSLFLLVLRAFRLVLTFPPSDSLPNCCP